MDIIDKLFKVRYSVRVPVIATYTEDELTLFGLPSRIVNDDVKKTDYSETTLVELTVNEMLDIYTSGYRIDIVNEEDIFTIYSDIENHLAKWRYLVANTMHVPDRPDEDLVNLDNFANEIFNNQKYSIAKELYKQDSNPMSLGFKLLGDQEPIEPRNLNKITRTKNLADSKNKYTLDDLLS